MSQYLGRKIGPGRQRTVTPDADGMVPYGAKGKRITPAAYENHRARDRARASALRDLARQHAEDYRVLYQTALKHGMNRRAAEERARRRLAKVHPRDYRKLFEARRAEEDRGPAREAAIAALLAGDADVTAVAWQYGVTSTQVARWLRDEPNGLAEHNRALCARRIESAALLAEVQGVGDLVRSGKRCPVCWGFVPRGLDRMCQPWCSRAWVSLRVHLDPVEREMHRKASARCRLNGDDPIQAATARRILTGSEQTHGRWVIPGSKNAQMLDRVRVMRAENVAMFGEPADPGLPLPGLPQYKNPHSRRRALRDEGAAEGAQEPAGEHKP